MSIDDAINSDAILINPLNRNNNNSNNNINNYNSDLLKSPIHISKPNSNGYMSVGDIELSNISQIVDEDLEGD